MTKKVLNYYRKFRQNPPWMLVGHNARLCLRAAKTLIRFEELEAEGLVRLRIEPEEENYFDVWGEPDTEEEREAIERTLDLYGCWYSVSEYLTEDGDWEHADSCGMHTGYQDPASPFENCYIIEQMQTAVEAAELLMETEKETAFAVCFP